MKFSHLFFFLVSSLFLVSGCLDETTIETDFEPRIIIIGGIDNTTDFIEIEIEKTVPVNSIAMDRVHHASIALYTEDPEGTSSLVTNDFVEKNGTYTSEEVVVPIIGNRYWIEVALEDGTEFVSTPELLKPPVQIDDIVKEDGVTRIVFSDPIGANLYLAQFVFSDGGFEFPAQYAREYSSDVLFDGNDEAFIEVFEDFGDGVEAELHNVNPDTYQFFLNLEMQETANEDFGEGGGDPGPLFRAPPVNILGNITNKTSNKRALGNFSVTSFKELRKQF